MSEQTDSMTPEQIALHVEAALGSSGPRWWQTPPRLDLAAQAVVEALPDMVRLHRKLDQAHTNAEYWQGRYYAEARTYWDDELPPGGECCADCGQPVESEPCPLHHPGTVVERLRAENKALRDDLPVVAGPATDAGYPPALPWAAWLDDEDLADLLDEAAEVLVAHLPASERLESLERVLAGYRLTAEIDQAQATAPGPDTPAGGRADAATGGEQR